MENNLRFNSSICTSREQSERLLALGLKKGTADCILVENPFMGGLTMFPIVYENEVIKDDCIPCWSLHRLIEMMPTVITHDDYSLILGINATCVYYADDEYAETFKAFEGNLYECVVKCIEWLIKEGYFNKEYLE